MEVKKFPQTLTEAHPLSRLRGHSLSGTPSQRKIKYKKSNIKYLEGIFGQF